MIKVKFHQGLREAELKLPAVPRVGETVWAPNSISGRVASVTWSLPDPEDLEDPYVQILVE
jgi:hypothetical protein